MTRKHPFNNYNLGFRKEKKAVSAEWSIFNVKLRANGFPLVAGLQEHASVLEEFCRHLLFFW